MEFNIRKLVRKQKTIILYREFPISRARMSSRTSREDEKWLWAGDGGPESRNYYKIQQWNHLPYCL